MIIPSAVMLRVGGTEAPLLVEVHVYTITYKVEMMKNEQWNTRSVMELILQSH